VWGDEVIAFFPVLSPDGTLIAAERQDGNGVKVAWKDNRTVVSAVGDGPGILINGALVYPDSLEPNAISAGGGTFCADYWINDGFKGLKLFDGNARVEIPSGYASAMADDGYLVYLTGHDDRTQQVRDLDGYVYDDDAPLEYPSCSRLGVVYSKYTGRTQHAKETWGALRHEQGQRFHASGEMIEHGPVAIDTPDGLYVGAFRDDGVILYKAGQTVGWFHPSPNARNLDGKWDGRGVRLVWNRPDGTLEERHQLLTDARVALAVVPSKPLPIPPVITPEPEPISMKLDPRVRALLIQFAAKFPVPQTPGGGEAHEERARQWSIRFCEQVAFSLPDEDYGTKRADSGRPISKDTISQQRDGEMVTWDLLVGTGTGEPSLNLDPHGEVTTGQVFVPVDAVNHLGGTVPEQPPEQPPTQPPAAGCNCAGEVAKVRQDITELTDMLLMLPANLAGLVEQIMDEKLSELPAPEPLTSFPHYQGKFFGAPISLAPVFPEKKKEQ
jgi:hypothetical protein